MAGKGGKSSKPGKKIKKNGYILFCEDKMRELKDTGNPCPTNIKQAVDFFSSDWQNLPVYKQDEYKKLAENERKDPSPPFQPIQPQPEPTASFGFLESFEPDSSTAADKEDAEQKLKGNGGQDLSSCGWHSAAVKPNARDFTQTMFGFTIGDIKAQERQQRAQRFDRKKECRAIFDLKNSDQIDPRTKQIILIKFNTYGYDDDGQYIPAEVGLVTFSLQDGVIDNYSTLIDPGEPPRGTRYAFMKKCKSHALPLPPYSEYCRDYGRILREIQTYINLHPTCYKDKRLLFCLRADFRIIESCFTWLYKAAGIPEPEEHDKYELRPIPLLFLYMFRNGADFHDRVKEEESKLPPEELSTCLSQKLYYDLGVPFYDIRDGRIRSRHLELDNTIRILDGEEYRREYYEREHDRIFTVVELPPRYSRPRPDELESGILLGSKLKQQAAKTATTPSEVDVPENSTPSTGNQKEEEDASSTDKTSTLAPKVKKSYKIGNAYFVPIPEEDENEGDEENENEDKKPEPEPMAKPPQTTPERSSLKKSGQQQPQQNGEDSSKNKKTPYPSKPPSPLWGCLCDPRGRAPANKAIQSVRLKGQLPFKNIVTLHPKYTPTADAAFIAQESMPLNYTDDLPQAEEDMYFILQWRYDVGLENADEVRALNEKLNAQFVAPFTRFIQQHGRQPKKKEFEAFLAAKQQETEIVAPAAAADQKLDDDTPKSKLEVETRVQEKKNNEDGQMSESEYSSATATSSLSSKVTDVHSVPVVAAVVGQDEDYGVSPLYMKPKPPPRASVWHTAPPVRTEDDDDEEQYGDYDPYLTIRREPDANRYILSLDYAGIVELCCPHHVINDYDTDVESCPLGWMNRIAFIILDATVGFWNIEPIEGKHYPHRNVTLEAQKRLEWSKHIVGQPQYGYKDIAGFRDSGEFAKPEDVAKNGEVATEPSGSETDNNNGRSRGQFSGSRTRAPAEVEYDEDEDDLATIIAGDFEDEEDEEEGEIICYEK